MRVLFFIETGGPGGAEQVVLRLAIGLQEKGFEVAVATLRSGWLTERLADHNITHHQIESSGKLDFRLPGRIAEVLGDYDVLHTHLFDSAVYGALGAKLAKKPHIATEHGDIHHIDKRKFSLAKLFILKRLVRCMTAVSNFSRDALEKKGISSKCLHVVGNPIDASQFETSVVSKEELGLTEISDETFIWIHVANHREVKDQSTLLKGFAKACKQSTKEQKLLLVGDGPMRSSLEKLVLTLGIESRVHFLGFRNDVAKLLSCANAAVLSSISEALPMSMLEAGAKQLALVSSDVGGIRDIIVPGETGLLFEVGDFVKLAECMNRIAQDSSLASSLALAAKERVFKHYHQDRVLNEYIKLYQSLTI